MRLRIRLGRSRLKYDRRTFQLDKYLAGVPKPPRRITWQNGIAEWPMHENDHIGDCTIAGLDNQIAAWTKNSTGLPSWVSDSDTLVAYSAISGYNPADPSTDQGATMLDALNYFRNTGVGGHTLYAYAQVTPTNMTFVRQSIWLFGGLYAGIDLPITARAQTRPGGTWTTVGGGWKAKPGTWGGHAMMILGYSNQWFFGVPWGTPDVGVLRISASFLQKYMSECYALLSSVDWAQKSLAPSGFDLATLQADLEAIKNS